MVHRKPKALSVRQTQTQLSPWPEEGTNREGFLSKGVKRSVARPRGREWPQEGMGGSGASA